MSRRFLSLDGVFEGIQRGIDGIIQDIEWIQFIISQYFMLLFAIIIILIILGPVAVNLFSVTMQTQRDRVNSATTDSLMDRVAGLFKRTEVPEKRRDRVFPNAQDLALDVIQTEGSGKEACAICRTNEVKCIFIPCGHYNFCVQCTRKICEHPSRAKCPACNGKIERATIVFQL